MDKRVASRKKAVNVSIDGNLAAEAKAAGINFSAVLEAALLEGLRERRLTAWREENRAAISAYNDFVEQNGLLSDEWRSF